MKLTIQLDTENEEDYATLEAIAEAIGLTTGGEPEPEPLPIAAAPAPAAPAPAKRGPGRPPKAAAAPAGNGAAAAPAAAPATTPAAPDDTLIPELQKIMSQYGELTEPLVAVKHLRDTLGYPSLMVIPVDQRQVVINSFKSKITEAMTA